MLKFLRRLCNSALLSLPLLAQANPFAYIPDSNPANAGNPCINVVDIAANAGSGSSSCSLHPGALTRTLELLPNGRALYVAVEGQNQLRSYTPGFNVAPADSATPVGPTFASQPHVLAASPDSQHLWIGREGSNVLTRLLVANNSTVVDLDIGMVPERLLINNRGTRLYVSSGSQIKQIDLTAETPAVLATWTLTGAAGPMAVNADDTRLYVAIPGSNIISARSTSTGGQVGEISASGVLSLLVSGTRLYAGTASAIQVWETGTLAIAPTLSGSAQWLAASADGDALYTADATGNWARIDTGRSDEGLHAVLGRFVGPYPSLFSFSADSFTELENVGTTTTITVIRGGDTSGTASVNYETYNLGVSNDYAQSGADYVAATGTLTFAPGVSEMTIPVQLIDDAYFGNTESFGLRLSLPDPNSAYSRLASDVESSFGIENDDADPRDRGGCSLGRGGASDPLLPLMVGISALVLWRNRKRAAC